MKVRYYIGNEEVLSFSEEIGRGGEGIVFGLSGNNSSVAKIYHSYINNSHIEKLKLLIDLRSENLSSYSAWPIELVFNERQQITGYLMPRLMNSRAIHQLFSPRDRQKFFPEASFHFLVHTAINLAKLFASLHKSDVIIGDVNHSNILVNDHAIVKLIDCDSLQVSNGRRTYLSQVGVVEYTPPELQNTVLNNTIRAKSHDLFGLAILIFQLLFQGKHPFTGINMQNIDYTLQQAILDYNFPYRNHTKNNYTPPIGAFPLESFGNEIAQLFINAFTRNSSISNRPSPDTWVNKLTYLENNLVRCSVNKLHNFIKFSNSCIWCNSNYEYFPRKTLDLQFLEQSLIDLDRRYQNFQTAVVKIKEPSELQLLNKRIQSLYKILSRKTYFPIKAIRRITMQRIYEITLADAKLLVSKIENLPSSYHFDRVLKDYNNVEAECKHNYSAVHSEYDKIKALVNRVQDSCFKDQLNLYLRKFILSEVKIKGVGPVTENRLFNLNIITASDIPDVWRGSRWHEFKILSSSVRDSLSDFKMDLVKSFKFNPNDGSFKLEVKKQIGGSFESILKKIDWLKNNFSKCTSLCEDVKTKLQMLLEDLDKIEFEVRQIELKASRFG